MTRPLIRPSVMPPDPTDHDDDDPPAGEPPAIAGVPVTAGSAEVTAPGTVDPADIPPVRDWLADRELPPVVAALWRFLRHEWTLASLGGLLLAVVLTWPTMADPFHTLPEDLGDPTLQAWQVAWTGHALLTDPANLWNANAFFPESLTLAYSDALLGYAPFGMFGSGYGDAVFRYNLLYVLLHALAFVGAYTLVRQLGSGRAGGVVAGLAFAYAPWRLAQAGHMHVLSTGGIALSLAMLARGHGWSLRHGYRPELRKPGWALAGWLTATWQISLGFGIGLPFGYLLGVGCLVVIIRYLFSWLRHRRRIIFGGRLFAADAVGASIFVAVTGLMALPYLNVVNLHPYSRRSIAEVTQYSVPLRGLVTAPGSNWLWGERHEAAREQLSWPPEMTMLPGVVLLCLAVGGIIFSTWRLWTRVLLVIGVLVSGALAMGTEFGDGDPGYLTLYSILPGWDALRTPGRLVVWTTLLLAILAAGAVSAIGAAAREMKEKPLVPGQSRPLLRPSTMVALLALIPILAVFTESINTTGHPTIWEQPAALRNASGPVLVLPAEGILEADILLWSTDGFPKVANGMSGFTPKSQELTRQATTSFPDAGSVQYLRQLGVRMVIWLGDFGPNTNWADVPNRPVDGLGITREQVGKDVVFRLN